MSHQEEMQMVSNQDLGDADLQEQQYILKKNLGPADIIQIEEESKMLAQHGKYYHSLCKLKIVMEYKFYTDGNAQKVNFINYMINISKVFNQYAMVLLNLSQFKHAKKELETLYEVLVSYQIQHFIPVIILTLNNLSCCVRRMGHIVQSQKYLETAYKIETKCNWDEIYSMMSQIQIDQCNLTELNLCAVYSEIKRHNKALDFAKKAIQKIQMYIESLNQQREDPEIQNQPLIIKELENQYNEKVSMLSIAYFNSGCQYEHMKMYDKCIKAYQKALKTELSKPDHNQQMINEIRKSISQATDKKAQQQCPSELDHQSAAAVSSSAAISHTQKSRKSIKSSMNISHKPNNLLMEDSLAQDQDTFMSTNLKQSQQALQKQMQNHPVGLMGFESATNISQEQSSLGFQPRTLLEKDKKQKRIRPQSAKEPKMGQKRKSKENNINYSNNNVSSQNRDIYFYQNVQNPSVMRAKKTTGEMKIEELQNKTGDEYLNRIEERSMENNNQETAGDKDYTDIGQIATKTKRQRPSSSYVPSKNQKFLKGDKSKQTLSRISDYEQEYERIPEMSESEQSHPLLMKRDSQQSRQVLQQWSRKQSDQNSHKQQPKNPFTQLNQKSSGYGGIPRAGSNSNFHSSHRAGQNLPGKSKMSSLYSHDSKRQFLRQQTADDFGGKASHDQMSQKTSTNISRSSKLLPQFKTNQDLVSRMSEIDKMPIDDRGSAQKIQVTKSQIDSMGVAGQGKILFSMIDLEEKRQDSKQYQRNQAQSQTQSHPKSYHEAILKEYQAQNMVRAETDSLLPMLDEVFKHTQMEQDHIKNTLKIIRKHNMAQGGMSRGMNTYSGKRLHLSTNPAQVKSRPASSSKCKKSKGKQSQQVPIYPLYRDAQIYEYLGIPYDTSKGPQENAVRNAKKHYLKSRTSNKNSLDADQAQGYKSIDQEKEQHNVVVDIQVGYDQKEIQRQVTQGKMVKKQKTSKAKVEKLIMAQQSLGKIEEDVLDSQQDLYNTFKQGSQGVGMVQSMNSQSQQVLSKKSTQKEDIQNTSLNNDLNQNNQFYQFTQNQQQLNQLSKSSTQKLVNERSLKSVAFQQTKPQKRQSQSSKPQERTSLAYSKTLKRNNQSTDSLAKNPYKKKATKTVPKTNANNNKLQQYSPTQMIANRMKNYQQKSEVNDDLSRADETQTFNQDFQVSQNFRNKRNSVQSTSLKSVGSKRSTSNKRKSQIVTNKSKITSKYSTLASKKKSTPVPSKQKNNLKFSELANQELLRIRAIKLIQAHIRRFLSRQYIKLLKLKEQKQPILVLPNKNLGQSHNFRISMFEDQQIGLRFVFYPQPHQTKAKVQDMNYKFLNTMEHELFLEDKVKYLHDFVDDCVKVNQKGFVYIDDSIIQYDYDNVEAKKSSLTSQGDFIDQQKDDVIDQIFTNKPSLQEPKPKLTQAQTHKVNKKPSQPLQQEINIINDVPLMKQARTSKNADQGANSLISDKPKVSILAKMRQEQEQRIDDSVTDPLEEIKSKLQQTQTISSRHNEQKSQNTKNQTQSVSQHEIVKDVQLGMLEDYKILQESKEETLTIQEQKQVSTMKSREIKPTLGTQSNYNVNNIQLKSKQPEQRQTPKLNNLFDNKDGVSHKRTDSPQASKQKQVQNVAISPKLYKKDPPSTKSQPKSILSPKTKNIERQEVDMSSHNFSDELADEKQQVKFNEQGNKVIEIKNEPQPSSSFEKNSINTNNLSGLVPFMKQSVLIDDQRVKVQVDLNFDRMCIMVSLINCKTNIFNKCLINQLRLSEMSYQDIKQQIDRFIADLTIVKGKPVRKEDLTLDSNKVVNFINAKTRNLSDNETLLYQGTQVIKDRFCMVTAKMVSGTEMVISVMSQVQQDNNRPPLECYIEINDSQIPSKSKLLRIMQKLKIDIDQNYTEYLTIDAEEMEVQDL